MMTAAELAAWRTGAGLSLTEAARRLGVGRRHYCKLESGECEIKGAVERLAALLARIERARDLREIRRAIAGEK